MNRLLLVGLLLGMAVITLSDRSSVPTASAQYGGKPKTEVVLTNNKFTPKKLTVNEGDTVTWINKEGVHTVKSDTDVFVSKTLAAGEKFSHQFTKAGSYPYYCTFHGDHDGVDMAGTIVVKKK
ncbi:MAG TPA: plastocyanin/azurin family copper-binding protein [Blastocatellia bacterium]|nr:plastocyanin/azurin family copper-binding protein [Blastocatellia bacterium]